MVLKICGCWDVASENRDVFFQTVVETCRRLKIPVRDYLGSVLPGLGDFPISRIAELTPAAWATRT